MRRPGDNRSICSGAEDETTQLRPTSFTRRSRPWRRRSRAGAGALSRPLGGERIGGSQERRSKKRRAGAPYQLLSPIEGAPDRTDASARVTAAILIVAFAVMIGVVLL